MGGIQLPFVVVWWFGFGAYGLWVCVVLLSVFIADFGWIVDLFIVLPLFSFASDLLWDFGAWVLGCCLFR